MGGSKKVMGAIIGLDPSSTPTQGRRLRGESGVEYVDFYIEVYV